MTLYNLRFIIPAMTNKDIEKKAQDCLDLVEPEIPVPIIKIANKLDIEVHEVHIPEDEKVGSVSSMLVKVDNKWLILLDQQLTPTRKRFAIAHALGHYFLHPNREHLEVASLGDTLINKEDNVEEEKSASYFGLCILMPANDVNETWKDTKNIKELANKFYVSQSVLALRLQSLNLVEGIL